MFIYVTRSKLFLHTVAIEVREATGTQIAERQERHFAPKSPERQEAPDWIRQTLTYQVGIQDGSIVDMTPPAPKPVEPAEPALKSDPAPKAPKSDGSKAEGDSGKDKEKDKDNKGAEAGLQKQ